MDLMPDLPKGIKSRNIHVLDSIVILRGKIECVRVSDISDWLKITMPSIALLVNDLEQKVGLSKRPAKKTREHLLYT